MAIIDCYDKRRGVTYVYDSRSYRNENGQPRAKRKLIGKRDPETGAILPTRKKKNGTTNDTACSACETTNNEDNALPLSPETIIEIDSLKKRITFLEKTLVTIEKQLVKTTDMIRQANSPKMD